MSSSKAKSTNTGKDPARPRQGTVHIYIDNSNLWIQGQKTYAEKKGLTVEWDPTWRFDVGRLKDILTRNSPLQDREMSFNVKVHLYGSTPPPVDTVWQAIKSHDVDVNTFARSTWTGREEATGHGDRHRLRRASIGRQVRRHRKRVHNRFRRSRPYLPRS